MKNNSGMSFIKLVIIVAIIVGVVYFVKIFVLNEDYKDVTGGEIQTMAIPLNISYSDSYANLLARARNVRYNNFMTVSPVLNRATGEINPAFVSPNSVLEQCINGEIRTDSVIGKNPENTDAAPYAIEFKTDADEIVFFASSNVRISVDNLDGKGYIMSSFEGCDNPNGYVYVDFGIDSVLPKNVKIETEGSLGPFLINRNKKIEAVESPQKKMLFIGDSWTQGQAIPAGKRYLSFSNIIADRLGMACINNGVSGSGYNELNGIKGYEQRLDNQLNLFHPDVIVISGGGNDIFKGRTIEGIRDKAEELFKKLKEYRDSNSDCKIVIIGVEYYEGVGDFDTDFKNLNSKLIASARRYDLPYIDLVKGSTYGASGRKITRGKSAYIVSNETEKYIFGDEIHPTQEGHKYLGDKLAVEMEKALKSIENSK